MSASIFRIPKLIQHSLLPVLPEYLDDLCVHQGRSVSYLRHVAGNHQSSVSPVPWEGILGNENDKLACDDNVMYCFRSIAMHQLIARVDSDGQFRLLHSDLRCAKQTRQQMHLVCYQKALIISNNKQYSQHLENNEYFIPII